MKQKYFNLIIITLLIVESMTPLVFSQEIESVPMIEETAVTENKTDSTTNIDNDEIINNIDNQQDIENSKPEVTEESGVKETEEMFSNDKTENRTMDNQNSGVIDYNNSYLPWRLDDNGTLLFEQGYLNGLSTNTSFKLTEQLNKTIVQQVETISFEDTVTLTNGMDELFYGFPNLKEVNHFENLNGTNVTSARFMFTNTPNLTHIDWSNQIIYFNKMQSMFEGSSIQSANLTNLSLPVTTDLSRFFQSCPNLSDIKINGLNAPKATKVESFIANTPQLTILNLENQTINLTNMSEFFAHSNVQTANLNNLNLPITTNMQMLFYNNNSLNQVSMDGINGPKVTSTSNMFLSTTNLKSIDWSNHTIRLKSLKLMFSGSSVVTVDFSNLSLPITTDISSLFSSNKSLSYITMDNLNAPNVTNSAEIFSFTTSLTNLDWSNHTIKIKNADNFFNYSRLVSLNLTNFNLPITISTKYFIGSVGSLTDFEIDGFSAPVSNNNWSWFITVGFTDLDWSHKTLNIPSTRYLFQRAKFRTINIDYIQLPLTKEADLMFANMTMIQSISMKHVYSPNLTSTTSFFKDSSGLKELEISFTPEVELNNTNNMFSTLSNIEILDISTINIEKSLNVIDMFSGMTSLRSLTLGERTVLEKSVSLPEAARDANGDVIDGFTGKWQTIGSGSIEEPNGKWSGTATELIAKSREKVKETYVWGIPLKVVGAGEIELLHFPSAFDFGISNSKTNNDQIIETSSKEHVVIRELRGMTSEANAGNWKLSVSAEQLTNKKQTETLDSSVSYLFKTTLKQYENEDDSLPPSNEVIFPPSSEQNDAISLAQDFELPTDGFAIDIMKATNAPDGRYALELEKTQLKIPKNVKTERTTYNGNVTWILADTI